jgi:hypothetical protein
MMSCCSSNARNIPVDVFRFFIAWLVYLTWLFAGWLLWFRVHIPLHPSTGRDDGDYSPGGPHNNAGLVFADLGVSVVLKDID